MGYTIEANIDMKPLLDALERIATTLEGLQPHVAIVGCQSIEVSRGADAEAVTKAVRKLVRERGSG